MPSPPLGPPSFRRFEDAYVAVLDHVIRDAQFVNAPRGNAARECLNVTFAVDDPRQRIVFAPARRTNIVFCFAEALWYLWGRNDLEMISYYAPRLTGYSADGRTLTGSAYGPKLFGPAGAGTSQWERIVDVLTEDPASKRAVAAFFGPDEPLGAANPDVSCTLALQFLLRDGRLHLSCYMRGNDAVIGLACDVFSFTLIQEFTARRLGVGLGGYVHHVGSMHINDADADRAAEIVGGARGTGAGARRFAVPVMPPTGWDDLQVIERFEGALRRDEEQLAPADLAGLGLAPYWQQALLLLEVYRQITHRPGKPVRLDTLEALDPAYRWLIAHRWPQRIPESFTAPAGAPR